MLELAIADNVSRIAMPAVGAGLGGLIWHSVRQVIEEVTSEFPNDIVLYVVEKYEQQRR